MKWSTRSVLVMLAAVLGLAAVAYFVVRGVRAIRFPFPLDYAEGPLLEQARLIGAGRNVYRAHVADYPYTVTNYPPGFTALLAALGKVFGFSYGLARVVTVAAAAACAAFIGRIASHSGDRIAGWIAGTVFLAGPAVVYWSAFVRVDFVALALSLGAILLVLRRSDSHATPPVAAVLVALAVMTRQSHLLAAPLAITGALAVRDPRKAAMFVAVLVAVLGGAVAGLQLGTRGGFWFHTVIANENQFFFSRLTGFLTGFAIGWGGLLLLACAFAVREVRTREPGSVLLALYLVGTALAGLTVGKAGSSVNYLLELMAAVSIFAGVAVARSARASRGSQIAVPTLVVLQLAWLGWHRIDGPERKFEIRGQFDELERVLAQERGRVLADETMGMLSLGGHPILVQPFEFTELVKKGVWDQGRVLRDVRDRRFALILINDSDEPEAALDRWTPEMLAAIHDEYESTGVLAEATLYRPRSPSP